MDVDVDMCFSALFLLPKPRPPTNTRASFSPLSSIFLFHHPHHADEESEVWV